MKKDHKIQRRISSKKVSLIVRCFVADCTATQTSQIVVANRNTVNRYYNYLRDQIVADALKDRARYNIDNGIEVDESYFGAKRVRGKRGRGAGNKIIVLGLLKREGNVFTQVIANASAQEIMSIIRKVVRSGSDIYTDGWRSYDALAVYGYNHKKVKHSEDEFVNGDAHINGIESFWSWTKRRLAKFNGIPKRQFARNLIESEWRFNHRDVLEKSLKDISL
ncbi:IS1595 family transposase [candidate division WWE3 bacterium CG22_combo_CG10-13_8_21_14_all_39_12]|uniref:IS1595 family transposase n=1 Tax=candidate division WWE3 bacterium CG22_combo_CG10-13_8_21_14_all_39_12 TaxID=1975094 RepID=A0A2H0BEJ6_UNCKA|nr:MAG: IS1595 family transposase [candidate division WWE3 bacterium CG22_combo_CG10-13_8_21_14_all_39_12]